MEFKASTLALDYMPVMIIDGHGKTPYYINPCDVNKLNPSCGEFCVEVGSHSLAQHGSTLLLRIPLLAQLSS